jgi:hypothetical protein
MKRSGIFHLPLVLDDVVFGGGGDPTRTAPIARYIPLNPRDVESLGLREVTLNYSQETLFHEDQDGGLSCVRVSRRHGGWGFVR